MLLAVGLMAGLGLLSDAPIVVVIDPVGPDGPAVAKIMVQFCRAELKEAKVSLQPRPASWASTAKLVDVIAATAREHSVAVVIDSTISRPKRLLVVTVVDKDAKVLYQKSAVLARRGYEAAVRNIAQAAAAAASDYLASLTKPQSGTDAAASSAAGENGTKEPAGAQGAAHSASGGAGTGAAGNGSPGAESASAPSAWTPAAGSTGEKSSRFRVHVGGGAFSFADKITSSTTVSSLDISVPGWAAVVGGVELSATPALDVVLDLINSSPTLNWKSATVNYDIHSHYIGTRLTAGYYFGTPNFSVGPLLGLAYEYQSVSGQPPIVVMPAFSRFTMQVGASCAYNRNNPRTMSGSLAVSGTPFGIYSESPQTSGSSSVLYGWRADLRLRYPVYTGFEGFVPFVEADGMFDQFWINYSGTGTRLLTDGVTKASGSTETRHDLAGYLAAGVAF